MTVPDDVYARIVLSFGAEPAAATVRAYVNKVGPVNALQHITERAAPQDVLIQVTLPSAADVRHALEAYESDSYVFLTPHEPRWPAHLFAGLPDSAAPPIGLWTRGGSLDQTGSLAITGCELPSANGRLFAADLAAHVASCGHAVVVPSTVGIPTAALVAAIDTERAPTAPPIVVLSFGFNAYGSLHRYDRVIDAGGIVVSEYPPGQRSSYYHRVAADRLVAALGRSTVVVEPTQVQRHTEAARVAALLGRPVFLGPNPAEFDLPGDLSDLLLAGAATAVSDVHQIAHEHRDLASLRSRTRIP